MLNTLLMEMQLNAAQLKFSQKWPLSYKKIWNGHMKTLQQHALAVDFTFISQWYGIVSEIGLNSI